MKLTLSQRLSLVFALLLLVCSGTSVWMQVRANKMHELEVVQGLSRDLAQHIARDTQCALTWRGLAGQRGKAVFHGGIVIRAGADGSEADLSNKNLLLSSDAEIDTQPVLEIHADEVKAAHGATVGQLDQTALFYLRSRGLPEADARRLLTGAFCREVVAGIDDETTRTLAHSALDAALARLGA